MKILKDRNGEPERGEWMGAGKNSSRRRQMLQQDEHGFQHTSPTYYPSWPRPCSHWSATSPRNQQSTSQTREHSGTPTSSLTNLNRSGLWAPPVRLVPAGGTWELPQKGPYTGQVGVAQRSDRFKPGNPKSNKQAYQAPNWPKFETAATRGNSELTQTFTQAKLNWSLHRSDRWEAPVRPVWPKLSGWTTPNRSTDLHKTLGKVGTPHGPSIAKILSTKTC
jgi:hypothetical protein